MDTFLQIIRTLKSSFKVRQNTVEELILEVEFAELGDIPGPAMLRFVRPSHTWASEWDAVRGEWRDVRGFSLPLEGEINEAHIKPVGNRFKLSFTELSSPLVRWGFTAEQVQVCRNP